VLIVPGILFLALCVTQQIKRPASGFLCQVDINRESFKTAALILLTLPSNNQVVISILPHCSRKKYKDDLKTKDKCIKSA
jgi:hypothetical protein